MSRVEAQQAKPLPFTSICVRASLYISGSEVDLGDAAYDSDRKHWADLGYRLIRPCGTAQLQIENEIRLVGPGDPQSRAKLTVIGKIGARTEKIELPYAGGWREDERPAAMGQMGAALSEVMFKLDPTYKQRAQEYFRKHPEEVPKR